MSSYQNDQAAGLRRIMASPKPRIVSIISATCAQNQPRLMTNLAVSILTQGCDVLVLHASKDSMISSYEAENLPTLLDVAQAKSSILQATKSCKLGYSIARLMHKNLLNKSIDDKSTTQLTQVFNALAQQYEIVLADVTLNDEHLLPLQTLSENEIIIQLTRKPESITQAYTLIKQICGQIGRRNFGIIVDNATEAQAQIVYRNISQVAKQFMQIELEFFGAIPADDHLNRASTLGRSVIDAFPLANASAALKKIAQRLDFKHDYASITKRA